jgi:hypothetical protein
MNDELLYINGIDATTGRYNIDPLTPENVVEVAKGGKLDKTDPHLDDLNWRRQYPGFATEAGLNPDSLAEVGWGVIFPHDEDPAIRDALSELLDHRKEQAGDYYKEFIGSKAYRPGESKVEFLSRNGAGPGPVHPKRGVPYYLLIVGDPEKIPYTFQSQLDVQFAVGRIHFDTLQEYAQYAQSVVRAEQGKVELSRNAAFLGVQNDDDRATQLSAANLITPLFEHTKEEHSDWNVQTWVEEEAKKAQFLSKLKNETPTFLFTASHGMGFPNGNSKQFVHQGALLCQDWPGPREWKQEIPQDHYVAADDITDDMQLLGMMAFFFACFGGGTPKMDQFSRQAYTERKPIAPKSFLSKLPQRLLSHPKGGALAVMAHVERAWGYSFMWPGAGKQLGVYTSMLRDLLDGKPIGYAVEKINERHAEIAVDLNAILEDLEFGGHANPSTVAGMWTANNDARGYAIIGDPAVRLPLSKTGEVRREPIAPVEIKSPSSGSTTGGPANQTTERPGPATGSSRESAEEAGAIPQADTSEMPDYWLLGGDKGDKGDKGDGGEERMGGPQFEQIQQNLTTAIQGFSTKLGNALNKAVSDATTLEVSTYVSDEVSADFEKTARLRAVTRIKLDGDVQVCVPRQNGEIDEHLWRIHTDMVKQAQAHRDEMLKTLVSAATSLIDVLK